MKDILEEVERLREHLLNFIEPYGLPIEAFEEAGIKGIYDIHENGLSRQETKFAEDLSKEIEFMPIEAIQAICLGAAYLMVSLGLHKKGDALASNVLLDAAEEVGFIRGMAYGVIHQEEFQRSMMAVRAKKRHSTDPKQAAKQTVREYWDDWQKGRTKYSGNAAFARDMLDKFPPYTDDNGRKAGLESQAVIERWCREWKSELG